MDYIAKKCKIEVKSPTAVTSGDIIHPMRYWIERDKMYILSIDQLLVVISALYKKKPTDDLLNEIIDFMRNSRAANKKNIDLLEILRRYNPSLISILEGFKEKAKIIDVSDITLNKRLNLYLHIKTGFGETYLPGSSIKGALEKIITEHIIHKENLIDELVDELERFIVKKGVKNVNVIIENKVGEVINENLEIPKNKSGEYLYDWKSRILISDAILKSGKTSVYEINRVGNINTLSQFIEAITPESELEFEVTYDSRFPDIGIDIISIIKKVDRIGFGKGVFNNTYQNIIMELCKKHIRYDKRLLDWDLVPQLRKSGKQLECEKFPKTRWELKDGKALGKIKILEVN